MDIITLWRQTPKKWLPLMPRDGMPSASQIAQWLAAKLDENRAQMRGIAVNMRKLSGMALKHERERFISVFWANLTLREMLGDIIEKIDDYYPDEQKEELVRMLGLQSQESFAMAKLCGLFWQCCPHVPQE